MRRRMVRRDLLIHAILGLVVGLFALVAMPPLNLGWPLGLQVAIAAMLAVATFGAASIVFVLPEIVWGLLIRK